MSTNDPNEDPVASYLSRYGQKEEDDPVAAYLSQYGDQPRTTLGGMARQFGRGVAESGLATGQGLMKAIPDALLPEDSELRNEAVDERFDARREGVREWAGEADTLLEKGAGVAGRLAGEAGQFVASGLGVGAAARGALALAPKAGRATTALNALSRPANLAQRVAQGAVADVPITTAQALASPEESITGGLAEMTDSDTLRRLAANPFTRVPTDLAFSLGAGAVADVGLDKAARALRDPLKVGDSVGDALRGLSDSDLSSATRSAEPNRAVIRRPGVDPERAEYLEWWESREAIPTPRVSGEYERFWETVAPPEPPDRLLPPGQTYTTEPSEFFQPDRTPAGMPRGARQVAEVPPPDLPPSPLPREGWGVGQNVREMWGDLRADELAAETAARSRVEEALTPTFTRSRPEGVLPAPARSGDPALVPARPEPVQPEGIEVIRGGGRQAPEPEPSRIITGREPPADPPRILRLDEAGAADPAVMRALARTGAGAVAGGAVDAAVGDDRSPVEGALVGAALAAGGPSLVRAMRKTPPTVGRPAYLDDPAVRRVVESVASEGDTPSLLRRMGSAVGETPERFRRLYTRVFNQSAPLERFGREVGGDESLTHEVSRQRGWQSAARSRLDSDFKGVVDLARGHEDGANALAKSERILELHHAGTKVIDPAEVSQHEDVVATLSRVPEVREAVDALRGYYRSLLDHKLQAGVIDQAQYDAIRASGQVYVPLVADEAARLASAGGGRLTNRGTGVRRFVSDKLFEGKTVDPYEQAVLDTFEAYRTAGKQRVTNIVASIAEDSPDDAAPFLRKVDKGDSVRQGRTVEAIVNGRRQTFEVTDEELYRAWAGMDPYTGNVLTKIMAPFKRALQFGTTLLPDFAISNAVRDNVQAGIQYRYPAREAATGAGLGAVAGAAANEENRLEGALTGAGIGLGVGSIAPNIARTVRAMGDVVGRSDLYEEWVREGGSGFGFYVRNNKDARKVIQELKREGVSSADIINPARWIDALGYIGRVVEEAPRVARYKSMREAGVAAPEAIHSARDISLDFSRIGADMRGAASVTAFLNAKVQGWDKLGRMLKDPKTWAIGASTITAPSIALWNINKDNPEYWDRPQWERNTFWLIPKPDGGFFRMPKPFEIGFLFASVPERILDYMHERDPETLKYALADMFRTTTDGTIPIPTMLEPMLENTTNFDLFTNRPIVSMGLERLPDEMQYDNRTSTAAVSLGGATGYSPQKIDNLLSSWFGGIAREGLNLSSTLARSAGVDDRPSPPTGRAPIVGRFLTREDQATEPEVVVRRRFENAERARNGARELVERGDEAAARKYIRENAETLREYETLKPYADGLTEVSKLRREISDAPDLTPEQKREALTRLNKRVGEILRAKD